MENSPFHALVEKITQHEVNLNNINAIKPLDDKGAKTKAVQFKDVITALENDVAKLKPMVDNAQASLTKFIPIVDQAKTTILYELAGLPDPPDDDTVVDVVEAAFRKRHRYKQQIANMNGAVKLNKEKAPTAPEVIKLAKLVQASIDQRGGMQPVPQEPEAKRQQVRGYCAFCQVDKDDCLSCAECGFTACMSICLRKVLREQREVSSLLSCDVCIAKKRAKKE